jgi:hypothetical protein
MTSVFPHAQGDVGGLCKRIWSKGATDDVTVLVLQVDIVAGLMVGFSRNVHVLDTPTEVIDTHGSGLATLTRVLDTLKITRLSASGRRGRQMTSQFSSCRSV